MRKCIFAMLFLVGCCQSWGGQTNEVTTPENAVVSPDATMQAVGTNDDPASVEEKSPDENTTKTESISLSVKTTNPDVKSEISEAKELIFININGTQFTVKDVNKKITTYPSAFDLAGDLYFSMKPSFKGTESPEFHTQQCRVELGSLSLTVQIGLYGDKTTNPFYYVKPKILGITARNQKELEQDAKSLGLAVGELLVWHWTKKLARLVGYYSVPTQVKKHLNSNRNDTCNELIEDLKGLDVKNQDGNLLDTASAQQLKDALAAGIKSGGTSRFSKDGVVRGGQAVMYGASVVGSGIGTAASVVGSGIGTAASVVGSGIGTAASVVGSGIGTAASAASAVGSRAASTAAWLGKGAAKRASNLTSGAANLVKRTGNAVGVDLKR